MAIRARTEVSPCEVRRQLLLVRAAQDHARAFYLLIQALHKYKKGLNLLSRSGPNATTSFPNPAKLGLSPGRARAGLAYEDT